MSRSTLLAAMMLCSLIAHSQDISVTFTGTGAATQIDSVKATNLATSQSVTFPGNRTLILTAHTGIPLLEESSNIGIVYPNPFSGSATFSTAVQKPQMVYVKVQNLVGQVVAKTQALVHAGENNFDLTVNTAGIYMVSLTTDQGTSGFKVICTDAGKSGNSIQRLGSASFHCNNQNNQNTFNNTANPGLKSSQTNYTLGYTSGEIILYKCFSGIYSTIVTDSLISSKNYEVDFAACTDTDGKNYSIVKIGDQTWMAENLAFLPVVSPSSVGSESSVCFYVYDYEGNSVEAAKEAVNYDIYGVLYNWEAAKIACPSGWHLPNDAEWIILTDYLTDSGFGYGGSGDDIGKSLASTGWDYWPNGGSVGNDQTINNGSGFSALPGGMRFISGGFGYLGSQTDFWSSSEDSSYASVWQLLYSHEGAYRYDVYRNHGNPVRCLKNSLITNTPPNASFTVSPAFGLASATFLFNAIASSDAETAATELEVRWDWNGDGTWDTEYTNTKTNSFQYAAPGTYSVILEVKDEGGLTDSETKTVTVGDGTFTDSRDSRVYHYVTIGTQTWMTENLAYLPAVSPPSAGSDSEKHFYVYGYSGSSVADAMATANYQKYGVLYNWTSAMDGALSSNSVPSGVRGVCPSGWHLPSAAEWNILETHLGWSIAGKRMKSSTGWDNNGNGDNSSGFNGLPGGALWPGLGFATLLREAYFTSSTEDNGYTPARAQGRSIRDYLDGVVYATWQKQAGWSVRCVHD